jgi:hypothetical protein
LGGLTVFIVGLLIFCTFLFTSAQIEKKQPTGYFVKVEALNVPEDITAIPIGTFVLYDTTGTVEIWRENVALATYTDDTQLENAIDDWALPYIEKYAKQVALNDLAKTSKIVGKVITHKQ